MADDDMSGAGGASGSVSSWDVATVQDAADAFRNLDQTAQRAGRAMTSAFASGLSGGNSLNQVLTGLGSRLSSIALSSALKPLEGALSSGLESIVKSLGSGLGGVTASAKGNVFSGGGVQAFARGGVVASPTFFPMSSGVGLMGEQGAEAIMPLKRGADGRLGVQAAGGRPMNVTVNITAREVDSFRGSQAQVSAAVARAVARGRRAM